MILGGSIFRIIQQFGFGEYIYMYMSTKKIVYKLYFQIYNYFKTKYK